MSKFAKIVVTLGVVLLFFLLFGALVGVNSSTGQTPGILGLILFAGFIGALRAIWKNKNDDDNDSSLLQK